MKKSLISIISLTFLVLTFSPAFAVFIGPMYPPPGGVTWAPSGSDPGDLNGFNWNYTNFDFVTGNIYNLYWAPLEDIIAITLNDQTEGDRSYTGAEILQLSADPNGASAVWTGSSSLTYKLDTNDPWTYDEVIETRYTVTLSGNASWINPGPLPSGIEEHNGAVAYVTGDFTANLQAEANFPNLGWMPINEGFNFLETLGFSASNFGTGFWYEPDPNAVIVYQPNGSEVLDADSSYIIRWETKGGISEVELEYSIDNGDEYELIAVVPNTGSYRWTIPKEWSDQCLIRISDHNAQEVNDISDNVFTIFVDYKLYVDVNATGNNDGSSWDDAFSSLSDALNTARENSTILVAQGIYTPNTSGLDDPREATFQLKKSVSLFGGYGGLSVSDPNSRNIRLPYLYETLLSGDLYGDDDPNDPSSLNDNSYHVISADDTIDETTVLNGFTITAGNADDGTDDNDKGGGMFIINASPSIVQSTFVNNRAQDGGAIYVRYNSGPKIISCNIIGNLALGRGGGMYADKIHPLDKPEVTNSIFYYNRAETDPDDVEKSQIDGSPFQPDINYTCLEGFSTYEGEGNIADDPNFVDSGYWNDDVFVAGDYHLSKDSPCINTGDPSYVPGEEMEDMDCRQRIVGSNIDMGIDEYVQPEDINFSGNIEVGDIGMMGMYWLDSNCNDVAGDEASAWCYGADLDMNHSVDMTDLHILISRWLNDLCSFSDNWCSGADINHDGLVDLVDFAILEEYWLQSDCDTAGVKSYWCYGADLDRSHSVDLKDFAILAKEWLEELPGMEASPG